jgi:tRNA threonylcarbamoyladenosine biosynthesis protein TsaE
MTRITPGEVETDSAEQTQTLGEQLGRQLSSGDVVALIGEFGSGKTTIAQGICRGLGVRGVVNSPSFTLINEYRGRYPVYHLDCYRLESEEDLLDLGYEEYFYGDGICLIEWAEKAAGLMPPGRIEIQLSRLGDTKRKIVIRVVEEDAGAGGGNSDSNGVGESGG